MTHPTKAGLSGAQSKGEKHKSLGCGGMLRLARPEMTASEFCVQTMELEEPGALSDEDGE